MDTNDSLTLARLDRESQDTWEAEYSYGTEADLHRHYNNCVKNPGHKNFIPVDKFSIEDLPDDYRDNDVFDYIRAVSELTVRVTVKNVSGRMAVGTARVVYELITNSPEHGPCKCKECRNSSKPVMDYATIVIQTASHVVFEDHDGEHTTCHLFLHRGNTPDTCSGVVTLTGTSVLTRNDIKDVCRIQHITHDLALARRLQQTIIRVRELQKNFRSKVLQISTFKQVRGGLDRQPLLFIVSHPHGCSKQISLGRWTSAEMFSSVFVSFLYNTTTCLGSSGASVCALPAFAHSQVDGYSNGGVSLLDAVHCGSSDLKHDLNFCRSNTGVPRPSLVSLKMLPLDKGLWEAEFIYDEEADLHQHYDICVKNPGHTNFIPAYKFSIEDLPEDYRHNDVFDYIRAVSELTVRVTVKYVSDRRPDVIPGSKHPYPHYSVRGQRRMTVGTGWVDRVRISHDSLCGCRDCRNSPTQETSFAEISILTSTHVVFDDLEAEHTTCHLFFDRGNTPHTCRGVVTLTGMFDVKTNLKYDLCVMKHFTHDLNLAHRLAQTLEKMATLRDTIFKKTLSSYKVNNRPNTADNQPLLLAIVSHPHGCGKQVSLGHWAGIEFDDDNIIAILYTTATCPGSSGALVCLPQAVTIPHIDVAFFTFRASHSGTSRLKDGINFCHVDPEVPMLQMFALDTLQMDEGPRKDNLCGVEENDPHKHFRSHENPGQERAVSVEMLESAAPAATQASAVSAETQESAVSVEKKESAVPVEKQDSAVSVEMLKSAVSVEKQESAVSVEKKESAVSVEKQESAVSVEKKESAVSVEKQESAVSVEKQESAVSVEKKESAVSVEKLVNILADLTVRVTVKQVIYGRPDTVRDPDIPWRGYNKTLSKLMRVGSGWVDGVEVFKNDICSCPECQKSLKPTIGFAHIVIQTADSLVFDEPEGQDTTYYLFLDVSKAPTVYTEILTLADVCQVHRNKTKHTSLIRFLTHNVQFGKRLKNMNQKHSHYLFSLTGNKDDSSASNLQQNGLNVEVSRPEGYGQRVRINCNDNPVSVDTRENLCASTLVTCLGFKAARMTVLEKESVYYCRE